MKGTSGAVGARGEDLAVKYLKKKGFKVIERNYHCSAGEIDLIARDKDSLVFVEIKARSSSEYGLPQEFVDRFKQRKMIEAARFFMAERRVTEDIPARFDVVAINLTPAGPQIELIRDAFHAE
jgi:putative endonuclease